MSNFQESFESGELWIRYPSKVLYPATSALSSIYLKYSLIDTDFYAELKNNNILNFDCFYDVIFIETKSGHIFDKIIFETNSYAPSNLDNHFLDTKETYKFVDYWLDEKNKKIYTSINQYNTTSVSSVNVGIMVEQFDIVRNTFNLKLFYEINLNFGYNLYSKTPVLEPSKISYNIDTKKFNISFILRGPQDEFGLISSNLSKYEFLEVDETNCFIPYCSSTKVNINVIDQTLLETDYYS